MYACKEVRFLAYPRVAVQVLGWELPYAESSKQGRLDGGRAAQRACRWQEDNPSHPPPGWGARTCLTLRGALTGSSSQTGKDTCSSPATFKADVWGFMWPALPLTWQTQWAQRGLGEGLCRDMEMAGWMGLLRPIPEIRVWYSRVTGHGPCPGLAKDSWLYLSAPESQHLLSGWAPLEVPPLLDFLGAPEDIAVPLLPRRWRPGCQPAVGCPQPTPRAHLGRGLPLGQTWGGSLA